MTLIERKKPTREAKGDDFTMAQQKLIGEVESATDRNDHTGAMLMVANYLKNKKFIKIVTAIQTIQEAEGSMPSKLSAYRSEVFSELIDLLKKENPEFGTAVYQAT